VVIPVLTQHYVMLQIDPIYMAITREKRLAILVGSKSAFTIAVRNDKVQKRYTYLWYRLVSFGSI
jgi:exodeoxyribonuclease V alpha subunit